MSDRIQVKLEGQKELLNMFKSLGNDRIRIRELTIFIRKAMKPIVNQQKANVLSLTNKTGKDFIMYRKGKEHILGKQQLARSIGVFKKFKKGTKLITGYYSGPRLKGAYKRMNKTGFFGLFIEYGTKKNKTGKGKINLKARPTFRKQNIIQALKRAGEEIKRKESKAIAQTIKRFQKKYV